MQKLPTGQNRPRELKVALSRWNGDLCMNISGLSLPYLCLDRTETSPFTHPCNADLQGVPEAMGHHCWGRFSSFILWNYILTWFWQKWQQLSSYHTDMFRSRWARKPTFHILVGENIHRLTGGGACLWNRDLKHYSSWHLTCGDHNYPQRMLPPPVLRGEQ